MELHNLVRSRDIWYKCIWHWTWRLTPGVWSSGGRIRGPRSCCLQNWVRCLSVKTIPACLTESCAKWCHRGRSDTRHRPRWMTITKYGGKQFLIVQKRLLLSREVMSDASTMVRSIFSLIVYNWHYWRLLLLLLQLHGTEVAMNFTIWDGTGVKINIGHTHKTTSDITAHITARWMHMSRVTWRVPT